MASYRDSYLSLPDTENLSGVWMKNSSAKLNYEKVIKGIDASLEHISERAAGMLKRVGGGTDKDA